MDSRKNPSFFKHLLSAVGVMCAILAGFALGLRVGDGSRREVPATDPAAFVDSVLSGIVVAPADTAAAEAPQDTLPKTPEISETTKRERADGQEYLTKHNRWNRDEMEQLPALQGLWDAVNTYSIDEIKAYDAIMPSTPLATIVERLEQNPKKGYYASRGDHVITLSTYIKVL